MITLLGNFPTQKLELRYGGSVSSYEVHAMFLQVGCKVPPPQPASHINENGLWNFIPVTNLMGGQTLETGRYSIRNVANGPINQHDPPNQEVWKDAPVTSSPDLTSVSHVSQFIPSNNCRLDSGELRKLKGLKTSTRSHSLGKPIITEDQQTE